MVKGCGFFILTDLRNAEFMHVFCLSSRVKFLVPIRRHLQTFVNREDAVPVEFGVGLVTIQFEKLRLVKGLRVGEVFPFAIAPV